MADNAGLPGVGTKYATKDEALRDIQAYAESSGFHVQRRHKKNGNHWIECSRAGKPAVSKVKADAQRNRAPSQKTECKWHMNIQEGLAGEVTITKLPTTGHNHDLDFVPTRVEAVSDTGVVNELSAEAVQFVKSVASIKNLSGNTLHTTVLRTYYKDIENPVLSKSVREKIDNVKTHAHKAQYKDSTDAFDFVAKLARLDAEGGFAKFVCSPEDGRLQRAIWASPEMLQSALQYGDTVMHVSRSNDDQRFQYLVVAFGVSF